MILNRGMLELENGVLFDDAVSGSRYFFYYKPVEASQENNRQSRRVNLKSHLTQHMTYHEYPIIQV